MPAGQGKDAERFAAALEQGTPPGLVGDADLARELQIAAMLRSRGAAFAPRPDEKARAKQRLMAMLAEQDAPRDTGRYDSAPPAAAQELTAPMGRLLEPAFPPVPEPARDEFDAGSVTAQMPVVGHPGQRDEPVTELIPAVPTLSGATAAGATAAAESPTEEIAAEESPAVRPGRRAGRHSVSRSVASRPGSAPGRSRRPGDRSLRRRTTLVSAAAVVMMIVLGTAGVLGSRDALPGDALYGVKRAAESAGLALTFDDAARAHRHLELASLRLAEMEQLAARSPQSAVDAELFTAAIEEFDAATGQGSRMLLAAEDGGGVAVLDELRAWAVEQSARLSDLRSALPAPAVLGADGSLKLLDRLQGRTMALEDRSSCREMTSGAVDDLGPLPAEGTCAPRPVNPAGSETDADATDGSADATTSPDSSASDSTEGSATPTTTPDGLSDPQLLPDLAPDGTRLDGSQGESPSTTADRSLGADRSGAPAPGLPPFTLPPLLPGLPPIVVG